jgi:hypothetical protein
MPTNGRLSMTTNSSKANDPRRHIRPDRPRLHVGVDLPCGRGFMGRVLAQVTAFLGGNKNETPVHKALTRRR